MDNKRVMITVLFVLSLVGAYSIYQPFLLSIVVAILLTMATYNLTKKLIKYFHSRKISALITSLLLILILFAPLVYMATTGVGYISKLDIAIINKVTSVVETFTKRYPISRSGARQVSMKKRLQNISKSQHRM